MASLTKQCQHLPARNHLLLLRDLFENVVLFLDKFGFKLLKVNWLQYTTSIQIFPCVIAY